ncbi:MAG: MFS transporter [Gemmatimonadaceae bacterium]|nr:MFS transporter [Gemmatimonadaceae bacterium]
MPRLLLVSLATILTLIPVTLLVPGLKELVQVAHGGSASAAHAFMTVNMLSGIIAVPIVMRLQRQFGSVRSWVAALLALDALVFMGMRAAPSLTALFGLRILDGALHLPAITLLMVAANRMAGPRRGGSLGLLGSSLMIGVAIGSPLGGRLVDHSPSLVYLVGAGVFVVAALISLGISLPRAEQTATPSRRYEWNTQIQLAWVPLTYAFMDRFVIGVFVSTFTLFLGDVHQATGAQRGMLMALFLVPFALLCWPAGRLADRIGWYRPLVVSNILFGAVFAMYGRVPFSVLPVLMVLSGVLSALMFAPNLLLTSEVARRAGDGIFGAFQIAGSVGFLIGPALGGVLVSVLRDESGAVDYDGIFMLVGALEVVLALASALALGRLLRRKALVARAVTAEISKLGASAAR